MVLYARYELAGNYIVFQSGDGLLSVELTLNWDSFNWRNYDFALGRFMNIDPLAEKYVYNSPYAFQENKMGLGRELEGLEIGLHAWLAENTVKNPDGLAAHTVGFIDGAMNAVEGFAHAIAHPIDTMKGNLVTLAANSGPMTAVTNPFSMGDTYDNWFGTNSFGATMGIYKGGHDLAFGDGVERGQVLGTITTTLVIGEGLGAVSSTVTKLVEPYMSSKVYRVFGGDAKADGFSWTPDNPGSVGNFRDAAGLPSGGASGATNTGQFIIEGTVKNKNIMQKKIAEPLDNKTGGGVREYIINPKNVKIKRVSGANPEF